MGEIRCAFTGVEAKPEVVAMSDEGEIAVGWIRVTVRRYRSNPAYDEITAARDEILAQMLAQLPDDADEAMKQRAARIAKVSADATFHAMLRDTPAIVEDEAEVWVSPTDGDPQVKEAWEQIVKSLGVGLENG